MAERDAREGNMAMKTAWNIFSRTIRCFLFNRSIKLPDQKFVKNADRALSIYNPETASTPILSRTIKFSAIK